MGASVSIVIATRDRPQLLRRAIDTIATQAGVGPLEIVVVFDQTDVDLSLERRGPDVAIRVMKNDRAPGLAGARNSGILEATAPVIAFCDDDDEWLPGKLAAQLALLEQHTDASLVTSGIYVRFRDRDIVRIPDSECLDRAAFLTDRMTEVHPSSFLFRAEVLRDQIGLVDEELPGSYAEDYDLILRATECGPIVSVPAPLVRVHWHAKSFFAERWRTIDEALEFLVDKHPDFATSPEGLARIRGQQAMARVGYGDRAGARALAREAFSLSRAEKRAPLALLASTGVVSPERLLTTAHRFGRGI